MANRSEPSIRLYIYIRISRFPSTVDIEFPTEMLARRYRTSIQETKELDVPRQTANVVAVTIPSSVIDLETNRSLQGFILHFDRADDAERWQDAICIGVKDHPRQVLIQQYWEGEAIGDLERNLPPSEPLTIHALERAGPPPGAAKGSNW